LRLQHVSIAIPPGGAAEARSFYGGTLGLEERDVAVGLEPGGFIWFRAGGDLELHLMLNEDAPPEHAHFCLAVDEELGALRSRLEAAGARTRDATPLVGRPRFFCSDPFGNLVELTRIEG
jgi:catechol 2,3-dioxygenase-like lactoylglutathione lyase family enzyme